MGIEMTTTHCIKYKAGFKYQLEEEYRNMIGIFPEKDIVTQFVCLSTAGELILRAGFAYDGPSGPTIDRKENMRGAAEHDGGYRLIRFGLLPTIYREKFDKRIEQCWIEDGMWPWVARIEVKLLKRFGSASARPSGEPLVYSAP